MDSLLRHKRNLCRNCGGAIFLFLVTCAHPESDKQSPLQACFDLQVEGLVGNVSASAERLKSLTVIQEAVEDTLNSVWPGSKVALFGSLSTGLGSSTSDVDLSVSLPTGYSPGVVEQARTAFDTSPRTYRHIHTRSRLPAVTFYYAPLNISCDVHFRNEGTFESELLQYLLSLDERILKLAIIVKYWAKLHKLISPKYLTSYGMMMMVIFYLQQLSVLPSVVELQRNSQPRILNATNHFNVAFERKNIVSKNNESLYEMLGGFFEFYEDFDFDGFLISPFIGRPVRKCLFKNLDAVPDEFYLYKSNVANNITLPFNVTALCIQSLLMLNDNCAWRVDTARRFIAHFRHAAQAYRKTNRCGFLDAIGLTIMD